MKLTFLGGAGTVNSILFAGFQAARTRGDRMIRGESEVKTMAAGSP